MNGYKALYGGREIDEYAETSYRAQQQALVKFQEMFPRRKVKSYEVYVSLCKVDGKEVVHVASE